MKQKTNASHHGFDLEGCSWVIINEIAKCPIHIDELLDRISWKKIKKPGRGKPEINPIHEDICKEYGITNEHKGFTIQNIKSRIKKLKSDKVIKEMDDKKGYLEVTEECLIMFNKIISNYNSGTGKYYPLKIVSLAEKGMSADIVMDSIKEFDNFFYELQKSILNQWSDKKTTVVSFQNNWWVKAHPLDEAEFVENIPEDKPSYFFAHHNHKWNVDALEYYERRGNNIRTLSEHSLSPCSDIYVLGDFVLHTYFEKHIIDKITKLLSTKIKNNKKYDGRDSELSKILREPCKILVSFRFSKDLSKRILNHAEELWKKYKEQKISEIPSI